jgi:hypothetical protein
MAVRPAGNSLDRTTLAVAARRSCPPQWRIFMEAVATTLSTLVGDDKALQILSGVGAAIAKEQPISTCQSLADLRSAMNGRLEALDWGQIDIFEAEKALEFIVVGYPLFEGVEAQAAFAAILEALLEAWLKQQALRPGLAMRLVERGSGTYPPLVFRYERIGS